MEGGVVVRLTIPAYAKINLSLDVVNRREDGYHNLRMVMQTISLNDTLTVETVDSPGISMCCNALHLPTDGKNLVVAAAERFFAYSGSRSVCRGRRTRPQGQPQDLRQARRFGNRQQHLRKHRMHQPEALPAFQARQA